MVANLLKDTRGGDDPPEEDGLCLLLVRTWLFGEDWQALQVESLSLSFGCWPQVPWWSGSSIVFSLATTHIVNPGVGFAAHMLISIIVGAMYAVGMSTIRSARQRYRRAILPGLLYGGIWWVLGGLVMLPLLLGMLPQIAVAFTPPYLVDLAAHLVYGVVTALVLVWLAQRREAPEACKDVPREVPLLC
jgi:hypothetical protein